MTEIKLLLNSVYNDLLVPTSQVLHCVSEIRRCHDFHFEQDPSLVFGESGSGISTAIARITEHFNIIKKNVVVLQRRDFTLHSPFQMLLHHYGFRPADSARCTATTKLPHYIDSLLTMARPDIIILDDFLNGVIENKDVSSHLAQWASLAKRVPRISIILGSPYRKDTARIFSSLNYRAIHINKWQLGDLFTSYLASFSDLAMGLYSVRLDLPEHSEQMYHHSQGNTGNLIRHLQQIVINLILNEQSNLSQSLARAELRYLIENNAKTLYQANL